MLVKGEVRKGTATEYALASKHKKPLLVYFLEDGSVPSLSVAELKADIQATDCCTYCQVKSFDDIEVRIKRDVIGIKLSMSIIRTARMFIGSIGVCCVPQTRGKRIN